MEYLSNHRTYYNPCAEKCKEDFEKISAAAFFFPQSLVKAALT